MVFEDLVRACLSNSLLLAGGKSTFTALLRDCTVVCYLGDVAACMASVACVGVYVCKPGRSGRCGQMKQSHGFDPGWMGTNLSPRDMVTAQQQRGLLWLVLVVGNDCTSAPGFPSQHTALPGQVCICSCLITSAGLWGAGVTPSCDGFSRHGRNLQTPLEGNSSLTNLPGAGSATSSSISRRRRPGPQGRRPWCRSLRAAWPRVGEVTTLVGGACRAVSRWTARCQEVFC